MLDGCCCASLVMRTSSRKSSRDDNGRRFANQNPLVGQAVRIEQLSFHDITRRLRGYSGIWRHAGLFRSRVRCGVDQHSFHDILRASSASSALAFRPRSFQSMFHNPERMICPSVADTGHSLTHKMRTPKSCQGLRQ